MSNFKDFIPEGEFVEPKMTKYVDFVPEGKQERVVEVQEDTQVVVKEEEVAIEESRKKTAFEQIKDAVTGAVAYKEITIE